jgi:hypothetical protein
MRGDTLRSAAHRELRLRRRLSRGARAATAPLLAGVATLFVAAAAPSSSAAAECTSSGTCGGIAGEITGPGADGGKPVQTYIYDSARNFVAFGGATPYSDGTLDEGNYYVCFVPLVELGFDWYVQQCYDGATGGAAALSGAKGVGVAAKATTPNINATMTQGGNIQGTVTDAVTGSPIAFVAAEVVGAPPQICVKGGATNCTSDGQSELEGVYRTGVVGPGTYMLAFSASGYTAKSLPATVSATHTTTLNVALQPAGGPGPGPGTPSGGGSSGTGSGGGTGGGGAGGGAATAAGTPGVHAQTVTITATGGGAVTVVCTTAGPCSGSLAVSVHVRGGAAVGASAGRRTKVVIGSARFTSLPAAKSSRVAFRLNAAGKRLLKRAHGKLKATVAIAYTAGGKTSTTSAVVVLRRSAGH